MVHRALERGIVAVTGAGWRATSMLDAAAYTKTIEAA